MTDSLGIVGGGIIGAALLYTLTEQYPGISFTLFEKESEAAQHQTSHNSGVVHAGLYYAPGSLKATLTRRGVELLKSFVHEHDLPYDECGKLLIATDESQVSQLERIAETARANGVPGITVLRSVAEIRAIEPNATGVAALHSPTTAITDYGAITRALLDVAVSRGATVLFSTEAQRIETTSTGARLITTGGNYDFDHVVACAGLQSDRLAAASGGKKFPGIVPFAGDYFTLSDETAGLVKGLIYPVPDPAYPFLGVHLTRMIDGSVTVGPDAFLAFEREGYKRGAFSVRDSLQIVTMAAFWRFSFANLKAAFRQMREGSKRHFAEQSHTFVPGITVDDLRPGPRGVRAQAMRSDGTLEEDFVIEHEGHVTHVRNAPSPAATSSLAIAEHILATLGLTHTGTQQKES